ncbi:hypothetical protein EV182_006273, partial [Spiromyces aspiralis]
VRKKDIDPLPPIDHSSIEYPEIKKSFYTEHPDIQVLDAAKVEGLRKELNLRVIASKARDIKPCVSFGHFGFDDRLIQVIGKLGYSEPTNVQKQAVPAALSGYDVIGIAKTGSGKTAAFVWPAIIHIRGQKRASNSGPVCLILAPTRELAIQIYNEARKLARPCGLKTAVIYGGASKYEQERELKNSNPDILVATPSRLIDMVKSGATRLSGVSFLVLDEADQMLNLGFEAQVLSICKNVRPDRQTLLFSATFPRRIQRLADEVTSDPVRITVGKAGEANQDVNQYIVVLNSSDERWEWLRLNLVEFTMNGSVLIFVTRKEQVDALAGDLQRTGFKCGRLHGDMLQSDRDKTLYDYKHQKMLILIATDVAARGLDIKS